MIRVRGIRGVALFAALALAACIGDSPNTVPVNDAGTVDADARVTEASVDAGPFTPKALPGLLFWMDASKGVTATADLVSKWDDQSGLKNDASQASSAMQPKLASNAIAGHAALQFPGGGTATNIDIGSPTKGFTGDFFVEIVMNTTISSSDTGEVFLAGNPTDNAQILIEAQRVEAGLYIGASAKFLQMPTSITPGVTHLVFMRRAATKFELGVDGATVSVPDASMGALSTLFRLGGPFMGQLAEVVGVDGVISPANEAALDAYLKAKYAL
ncbi:hypothetical protein BH09MYX1_BH09MYX1_04560 [soil metagenome]